MASVSGSESSFDRALNLINRAVGMLRGGNNLESQREGSSPSDVQHLPAASTSSTAGSLPAANTSNGASPRTPTELSRLFPDFMRPSPAGSTQWSPNPWKPKQRGTPYQRFKPKDSWTHVFVCLPERDDSYVRKASREKSSLRSSLSRFLSGKWESRGRGNKKINGMGEVEGEGRKGKTCC